MVKFVYFKELSNRLLPVLTDAQDGMLLKLKLAWIKMAV
jgi:hypothetical protein